MSRHTGTQPVADEEFARLFETYWPLVYRVCWTRLSRAEDAEDAALETLYQFSLTDRTVIANPSAWLTTVASRVCFHALRKRYATSEFSVPELWSADAGRDPAAEAMDEVWFQNLGKLLSPADHELLSWLYLYRLPFDRIAQLLGVTNSHARVLAFRARQRARFVIEGFDSISA